MKSICIIYSHFKHIKQFKQIIHYYELNLLRKNSTIGGIVQANPQFQQLQP